MGTGGIGAGGGGIDRSRRLIVGAAALLLCAAVALSAAVAPASAAKKRYATKVPIRAVFDTDTFEYVYKGKLRSERRSCTRKRTVSLFHESEPGIPFATTASNRRGRWEIRLGSDGLGGNYYVRVDRKVKPRAICKRKRSKGVPAPSSVAPAPEPIG